MNEHDAYSPEQIAARVQSVGVHKSNASTLTLLVLGLLAGAFIALGGIFYAVVITDSALGFGPTRLLGGVAFSLGLILVVVAGAELFTGNNLVAMAWASGLVSARGLLRNWIIVYVANVAGAVGTAVLIRSAATSSDWGGRIGAVLRAIVDAKLSQGMIEALARGVLCNALVCLAVWLSLAGRSVSDKILAVVMPVAAFVACGFEHSIANWFFISVVWLEGSGRDDFMVKAPQHLAIVSVGNILGGTLLVALVYWMAYLRPGRGRVAGDRG